MPNFFDLLKYAKTGIASPDMTHFDKMRARAIAGGFPVNTIEGVPPLTFQSDGKPLISWSILGNAQQTGTPTPDAPITPTFCGELVGSDWAIPLTCAGQTVPVYLGQTQTVRRVRKYEFTGNEQWNVTAGKFYLQEISPDYKRAADALTYFCSHFPVYPQTNRASNVPDNMLSFGSSSASQRVYCTYTGVSTTADFKSYLAAQYAAGTPVTVWYVLATPETGIVNEPLCKIGDYADELHSTDAGVTIPTAKGENTLTFDPAIQPSKVSITGTIKE